MTCFCSRTHTWGYFPYTHHLPLSLTHKLVPSSLLSLISKNPKSVKEKKAFFSAVENNVQTDHSQRFITKRVGSSKGHVRFYSHFWLILFFSFPISSIFFSSFSWSKNPKSSLDVKILQAAASPLWKLQNIFISWKKKTLSFLHYQTEYSEF